MRYTYNKEHGLLYVYLTQAEARPEEQIELLDGSVADVDASGDIIGIEVLSLFEWRPELVVKEFGLSGQFEEALQGLRTQLLSFDSALVVA